MMRRSLSTKLMIALTIIMIVVASIVLFVNYKINEAKQRQEFEQTVSAQIALINSSVLEAVFAYDMDQIQTICNSLVNTALVTEVKMFDHRGKSLATAVKSGNADFSSKIGRNGLEIVREKEVIGRYDIVFSTSELDHVLVTQLHSSAIVIISLLIASLATVFVLSRSLIVSPIASISESLDAIAAGGGDLTRRLPTTSGDEVAVLSNNFNRVMEQIGNIIKNVTQVTQR